MYFQKFASAAKTYAKNAEDDVRAIIRVNSSFLDNKELNFFCQEILNFLKFVRKIFELILMCFKPFYAIPFAIGGCLFRAKVNINVNFYMPDQNEKREDFKIPHCNTPDCSKCQD